MMKPFVSLAVAASLCCSPSCFAQKDAPTPAESDSAAKVKQFLPSSDLFSDNEIRERFDRLGFTPFENPAMRFELLTPKDWESRPLTVPKEVIDDDTQRFVPLAEIGPKDGTNTVIEVQYIRVPERVALSRILNVYAEKSGFKKIFEVAAVYNGRNAYDALLSIEKPEFGTIYTRLTLSRKGELVFVVATSAQAKDYDKYKKIFGAAAVTFKLLGK